MNKAQPKILLIEDDTDIARIIGFYLNSAGFEMVHLDKADGLGGVALDEFCIILLDILLPGVDGFEICQSIRHRVDCPIIFISCLDDSDSIIKALDMGGDDYLTKPFDSNVLIARIKANLRRIGDFGHRAKLENIYRLGPVVLDTQTRTLENDGAVEQLTNIEFQSLIFLMDNPRRHFTSDELYTCVWGKDSFGDARTVQVHIHNIRKKLTAVYDAADFVVHDRGNGYAFIPEGRPTS